MTLQSLRALLLKHLDSKVSFEVHTHTTFTISGMVVIPFATEVSADLFFSGGNHSILRVIGLILVLNLLRGNERFVQLYVVLKKVKRWLERMKTRWIKIDATWTGQRC